MFDGVDEIHRDRRRQMADEIGELIQTYPDCTYVVTTRPGAVESGWLSRLNFIEAHVEPMSPQDREEFIDKWYRSAALELRHRTRAGENLILTASKLKMELVEQTDLGLLATNPLLCAMICALYRERRENLPETSAELSEALCHMLLHRREKETPGLEGLHFYTSWQALQYSQKKGLLAEIAWHMVINDKSNSSIEREDTKNIIANVLNSIPGQSKEDAEDIVQALVERSGMLRPTGEDRIDFLHNTLKEYLAANYVVENGNWQCLTKYADDPAWQPVILYSLALAPESFSSDLVRKLLSGIPKVSTNRSPKKTGALKKVEREVLVIIKSRQFFLVRCKAAAKRLAADLSIEIEHFMVDLLPPSTMNEVEAVAQLGSRIFTYCSATLGDSKWWAKQDYNTVLRCLRLLRRVGGKKAKDILKVINWLPFYNQLINEWVLACNELSPDEHIKWPINIGDWVILSSPGIKDISPLKDLSEIQTLYFGGTKVSSLIPLTGLTSLQNLSILGTHVSELIPLAKITSLQYLNISDTPVNDLSPLSELVNLKRLDCRKTKVFNLTPITRLINLEYLNLGNTQVTDIVPLKYLLALKYLSLNGIQVTDISPLNNLRDLKAIGLGRTIIEELDPIANISSLNLLDLSDSTLNDFTCLSKLSALEYLNLSGTKIIDLSPLSNLDSLRTLILRRNFINDLSPLSDLQSLNTLLIHQIDLALV